MLETAQCIIFIMEMNVPVNCAKVFSVSLQSDIAIYWPGIRNAVFLIIFNVLISRTCHFEMARKPEVVL